MEAIPTVNVALQLALVASLSTVPPKASAKQGIKALVAARDATKIPSVSYHLKTLLLFTKSDLKTVLLPWALFGVAHALSAPLFQLPSHSSSSIMARFPLVLIWLAVNLLPFCIGNQRHPDAISEDAINKAWRPIPAKRITPEGARNLMIATYLFAFGLSSLTGGAKQCVALAILGFCYNDLNGGDKSFVSRGLLNGLGFVAFGSGAMEVAYGQDIIYTPELINWLAMIVLIVATGIQAADIYDLEGDKLMGRSTLSVVIGDEATRWTMVINTLVCSFICLQYWEVSFAVRAAVLSAAAGVAKRYMKISGHDEDKKTYKFWNLWLVAIYCLPLFKVLGSSS